MTTTNVTNFEDVKFMGLVRKIGSSKIARSVAWSVQLVDYCVNFETEQLYKVIHDPKTWAIASCDEIQAHDIPEDERVKLVKHLGYLSSYKEDGVTVEPHTTLQ